MTGSFFNSGSRRQSGTLAILWGGGIGGALDIAAAAIDTAVRGHNPVMMLKGIASGLIGRSAAFSNGFAPAVLGLVCHFTIAFGAAALYYLVSRKLRVLVERPVLCGLLYGFPIYLVTNFVIVPLSKIGHLLGHSPEQVIQALVILMVCVGLPIGMATRRYSR
jgi:hypothetical protein